MRTARSQPRQRANQRACVGIVNSSQRPKYVARRFVEPKFSENFQELTFFVSEVRFHDRSDALQVAVQLCGVVMLIDG